VAYLKTVANLEKINEEEFNTKCGVGVVIT